jgi:hypothetical protein
MPTTGGRSAAAQRGGNAVSGATKRLVYEPYNVIFFLEKKRLYMIDVTENLPH